MGNGKAEASTLVACPKNPLNRGLALEWAFGVFGYVVRVYLYLSDVFRI